MKSVFCSGARTLVNYVIFLFVCCFLFISKVQSQILYLSTFADPAGKYVVSQPGNCFLNLLPPSISNVSNVSNLSLSDYATLDFELANATLACTSGEYLLIADLNLNGLSPNTIPASITNPYYTGFKIRISSVALINLLGGSNNINVRTYLNGTLVESAGPNVIGISALQAGTTSNIGFSATRPFNQVAIAISPGILNIGLVSSMNFFYGFATTAIVLPVKLTSFSASVENKKVVASWIAASENGVAKYELQRSSSSSDTSVFNTIATIAAKGSTSTEAKYSFSDGTALAGNYIYRLKMIDKDGSVEYSRLALVKIAANNNWKVYPTILSSNTNLSVIFSMQGNYKAQVQLANLHGQILRSASTSTDNKLTVSTNGLQAGIYLLKLYKDGKIEATEKVVIQ